MIPTQFQKEIEKQVKKKVELRINDNRSTMLSVKWEPGCTKVSLHRIFLDAPENVMEALACHIRKKNSVAAPAVKAFIEERMRMIDYSHRLKKTTLSTSGNTYDLQQLYDEINREYFGGKLSLAITWYGRPKLKNRSRITFGLYSAPLRLIKIHRMMDRPFFPEYFVRFVIYHEMLHHLCPSYYDEKGRHSIHTKEFKSREKEFREYARATAWLNRHYDNFFM